MVVAWAEPGAGWRGTLRMGLAGSWWEEAVCRQEGAALARRWQVAAKQRSGPLSLAAWSGAGGAF